MTSPRRSLVPGIVLAAIGLLFLAPFVYRDDVAESNVVGASLALIIGPSLLWIGFASIRRARDTRVAPPGQSRQSLANLPHGVRTEDVHRTVARAGGVPDLPNSGGLRAAAKFFRRAGHAAMLLALVATLLMPLVASTGGASGVPIGIGVLLGGLLYGFAVLCEALA